MRCGCQRTNQQRVRRRQCYRRERIWNGITELCFHTAAPASYSALHAIAPVTVTPLAVGGALVIGASLGLLGGGGSILTVPIFVYAVGLDPKLAVAASLPVVAITSASAAIVHWRLGNVQLRTALIFGAMAAVGAFAGARGATLLSGATQFALLALVMLGAAYRMLSNTAPTAVGEPATQGIPFAKLMPVALGVGILTGIVGIGGGFLIVPTLVLICRLPMRTAVGTSLLVIAMNAASGAAGYAGTTAIPWNLVLLFAAISVAGSLGGSRLSAHIPQEALRRGFGALLALLSVFILFQNRHVFAGWLPS